MSAIQVRPTIHQLSVISANWFKTQKLRESLSFLDSKFPFRLNLEGHRTVCAVDRSRLDVNFESQLRQFVDYWLDVTWFHGKSPHAEKFVK
jgi:hypothetical protein